MYKLTINRRSGLTPVAHKKILGDFEVRKHITHSTVTVVSPRCTLWWSVSIHIRIREHL